MVTINTFLLGLMVTSTMTGLVTEAIKKILSEHGVRYKPNTLAGIVSVVLSAAISIAYIIVTSLEVTTAVVVCAAILTIMSWLCSMVGYDKVMQTIQQFATPTDKEE